MTVHLFVDESRGRDYLLVAACVVAGDVTSLRKEMRSYLRPGQRSIHFTKEADATRSAFAGAIEASAITAAVYRTPIRHRELAAREACVRAVARDAVRLGAQMIVLDQDDSLMVHYRRWLFQELHWSRGGTSVRYEHRHRHEDPLLWVPDAIAWCWQRGGRWRERFALTVIDEFDVEPL